MRNGEQELGSTGDGCGTVAGVVGTCKEKVQVISTGTRKMERVLTVVAVDVRRMEDET